MMVTEEIWTHKYIDDTTLSEAISSPSDSRLQVAASGVEQWSRENKMRINGNKTKEMLIHFRHCDMELPEITLDDKTVERVTVH